MEKDESPRKVLTVLPRWEKHDGRIHNWKHIQRLERRVLEDARALITGIHFVFVLLSSVFSLALALEKHFEISSSFRLVGLGLWVCP